MLICNSWTKTVIKIFREMLSENKEIEYQCRMKEIKLASKKHIQTSNPNLIFDLTKNIMLVPPFRERKVDKYLTLFEKVAENLK